MWICRLLVSTALVGGGAEVALAHLPGLHGHLVELVEGSDRVVIGRVSASEGEPTDRLSIDRRVIPASAPSDEPPGEMRVRGVDGMVGRGRCLVFLRRDDEGWTNPAQRGTVFLAPVEDDEIVVEVVNEIRDAVQEDDRVTRLRSALISALRAKSAPLRYHAALDLVATITPGEPLTVAERSRIESLLEKVDPALRPLLEPFLVPSG